MSNADPTPPPSPGWFGVELRASASRSKGPAAIDTLAKTLAGGYVFVAFILTTVGALQGGLERLLLNHPHITVLGLVLAGAGIGLAFVDLLVTNEILKWFLLVVAFFLFALGVALLIWFSTSSLSENERPAIATEASMAADGSKLKGKVTAFGLMSDDWVYLSVKGFEQTAKEETAAGAPVLLYQTRAGPDRNGKVDLSFDIPVAFGRFSFVRIGSTRAHKTEDERIDPCFVPLPQASEDQSCATLYPPPGPKRPTLSASWEKSGDVNVLNVTIKTSGVDPDDVVMLDMAGNSETENGNRRVIFYRSMFSSSSTGVVDATAKAPMPKGMTRACVVATTISTADVTPLQGQPTRICALGLLDLSRTSFAVITVP